MKKTIYILKHPATWAFIGTLVGAWCPQCTPWVTTIGGLVAGG